MKCSFVGCNKEVHSCGLCGAHYSQKRLGKELRPLQLQHHGLTEIERFKKWYAEQPNGCWLWLGTRAKIRNQDWHGRWRSSSGTIEVSSRAAWRLMRGEVPKGICVLHRCDNPLCVNPDHLFLGSMADNVADMWDKGRARQGISRGEAHGCSKLTDALVREIKASKESGPKIAKRLNISTSTLYDVRNGKIWRHVK